MGAQLLRKRISQIIFWAVNSRRRMRSLISTDIGHRIMNLSADKISLVSRYAPEYRKFGSRRKAEYIQGKVTPNNPAQRRLTLAMEMWEERVRLLLGRISNSFDNQIIKYPCPRFGVKFREVDYISTVSPEALVLLELKSKKQVLSVDPGAAGWDQLEQSLSLLETKGLKATGVGLVVDMSRLHFGRLSLSEQSYDRACSLEGVLTKNIEGETTLVVDVFELRDFALEHGVNLDTVLKEIKEASIKLENEEARRNELMESLKMTEKFDSPFAQLSKLLN